MWCHPGQHVEPYHQLSDVQLAVHRQGPEGSTDTPCNRIESSIRPHALARKVYIVSSDIDIDSQSKCSATAATANGT